MSLRPRWRVALSVVLVGWPTLALTNAGSEATASIVPPTDPAADFTAWA